ncbi:MAG: hypothetical protein ACI9KR_000611 [Arcticibacterium sp.]|jgi:hypothetical protein
MLNKSLLFLCLIPTLFWGQTYEVGAFLGGANAMTDIGAQEYINPRSLVVGGIFKWNKSQRYAWRAQLNYALLNFDDKQSKDPSRVLRNYKSDNSILELSAGLEVNFIPYNLHKFGPAFSPYLYSGVTVFSYDYLYFDKGIPENISKKTSFALPLIFGAKARVGSSTILGAEIGVRFTFTDNLDGSNPINSNFAANSFGDINNNDWYVFSGITITYTFTRKPCQDCFD